MIDFEKPVEKGSMIGLQLCLNLNLLFLNGIYHHLVILSLSQSRRALLCMEIACVVSQIAHGIVTLHKFVPHSVK